jgi:hypothetical protein
VIGEPFTAGCDSITVPIGSSSFTVVVISAIVSLASAALDAAGRGIGGVSFACLEQPKATSTIIAQRKLTRS